jgi:hypothetical protein
MVLILHQLLTLSLLKFEETTTVMALILHQLLMLSLLKIEGSHSIAPLLLRYCLTLSDDGSNRKGWAPVTVLACVPSLSLVIHRCLPLLTNSSPFPNKPSMPVWDLFHGLPLYKYK